MKQILTSIPAILLGTAAFATIDIGQIDMNGDDFASYEELSAAYSGLSTEEFEQIDANKDNRVSSEELYATEAQQIVSQYEVNEMPDVLIDFNGDGFSEYDEISRVFVGLAQEDFEQMDMNGDNRLSQQELYETDAQDVLNRFRSTEDVATVKKADVDGDSFLSEGELMSAYPGLTENEFEQIDTNGDNRVDYSELYETEAQNILSRYEG